MDYPADVLETGPASCVERMNRKEYKKKIAGLLSYKFPKSDKHKRIKNSEEQTSNSDAGGDRALMESNTMSVPAQKSASEVQAKKRDVIIIGAGLSGE